MVNALSRGLCGRCAAGSARRAPSARPGAWKRAGKARRRTCDEVTWTRAKAERSSSARQVASTGCLLANKRRRRGAVSVRVPYVELRCRSAFSFLAGASYPKISSPARTTRVRRARARRSRRRLRRAALLPGGEGRGPAAIVGADVTVARRARHAPRRLLSSSRARRDTGISAGSSPRARARTEGRCVPLLDEVEAHARGLVCLAGGERSRCSRRCARATARRASYGSRLLGIFGADLCGRPARTSSARSSARTRVAGRPGAAARLPVVATGDVRHRARRRAPAPRRAHLPRAATTLDDAGRTAAAERRAAPAVRRRDGGALRATARRWLAQTRAIAERCEFTLAELGYRFPDYPAAAGRDADGPAARAHLRGRARALRRPVPARARRQLEHELARHRASSTSRATS